MFKKSRWMMLIALCALLAGCSSAYYGTMEKFGVHKREIMVDRVEEARDAQEDAKEQFQSAYEQFSMVVHVDGGDLERHYELLKKEYEASEDKAEEVHDRIVNVESVAEALFVEWQSELSQYSSDALRRDSERKMAQTRKQYEQLIWAMKRAEEKIQPVLVVFHDQVLYLKHNLNARAIASLQGELVSLERNVQQLLQDMESSISEANQFISHLQDS